MGCLLSALDLARELVHACLLRSLVVVVTCRQIGSSHASQQRPRISQLARLYTSGIRAPSLIRFASQARIGLHFLASQTGSTALLCFVGYIIISIDPLSPSDYMGWELISPLLHTAVLLPAIECQLLGHVLRSIVLPPQ